MLQGLTRHERDEENNPKAAGTTTAAMTAQPVSKGMNIVAFPLHLCPPPLVLRGPRPLQSPPALLLRAHVLAKADVFQGHALCLLHEPEDVSSGGSNVGMFGEDERVRCGRFRMGNCSQITWTAATTRQDMFVRHASRPTTATVGLD